MQANELTRQCTNFALYLIQKELYASAFYLACPIGTFLINA